ncbi:MAG: alkaline phosphatase, partial [Thermoanaerobaculales bacterium]|nr:alkaline phosphatase [Thermoanaerobaculales bacterium]
MRCKTVRSMVFLSLLAAVLGAGVSPTQAADKVKNVIVLVPDGCSSSVFTAARWVKGEPLAIDGYASGMLQTWMANSIITGSAAAATAFATGEKTSVRFLGVGPRPDDVLSTFPAPPAEVQYAPIASVLEGAKVMGKATGLVATSRITHATPAAFAVHIHDRGLDNEIMEHIVYNGVDVVFGGGHRHLIPADQGGKRTDGENLETVLVDRGYEFVTTRDELMSASSDKVWGMFASSHMEADMDRAEFAPTEPSLAEMTTKAIEILSRDSDGFFLMVEGSQIDWAGHNNDPIYMITDTLAFDEAFQAAVDFAVSDGDTLVIAFPDHNTGAMAIGHNYTQNSYTATPVEDLTGPLAGMRISSFGVA